MQQNMDFNVLLDFLYNNFAVTFLMCMIGAFIRESMGTVNGSNTDRLSIKKIIASTIFSTFVMCACANYLKISFSIYAAICVFVGMWGYTLVRLALTGKFVKQAISKAAKIFPNALLKVASSIVEEDNKDAKDEDSSNDKRSKKA